MSNSLYSFVVFKINNINYMNIFIIYIHSILYITKKFIMFVCMCVYVCINIYIRVCVCVCVCVCKCKPPLHEKWHHHEIFVRVIHFKCSNLENKLNDHFLGPAFVLNVILKHPNSWYNGIIYEILIRILHSFINRNINIIIQSMMILMFLFMLQWEPHKIFIYLWKWTE